MSDLIDDVEIYGWTHLFSWPIPTLFEKDVKDFHYNMKVDANENINATVKNSMFIWIKNGYAVC